MSKAAKFEGYTDAQIYAALIERDPRMIEACQMLAEMQVLMGRSDEWILSRYRVHWDPATRDLWDEEDEFRGKLILRAAHHVADRLRAKAIGAASN